MKLTVLAALSVAGLSAAALGISHGGFCGGDGCILASKPANAAAVSTVALVEEGLAASEWKVDPVHSSMFFRIKHMNTAWFYGRFNEISGTIGFDPAKPDTASFDVEVKTASVDTNNKGRDKHLTGSDFFNADQFPTCTFKSTSVSAGVNDNYELKGDLTINGQTKPITAKLEKTGEAKTREGTPTVGFEATFVINRNDFGVKYGPGALGDEVRVTIALEAIKK